MISHSALQFFGSHILLGKIGFRWATTTTTTTTSVMVPLEVLANVLLKLKS
jgi:hypothetical protein